MRFRNFWAVVYRGEDLFGIEELAQFAGFGFSVQLCSELSCRLSLLISPGFAVSVDKEGQNLFLQSDTGVLRIQVECRATLNSLNFLRKGKQTHFDKSDGASFKRSPAIAM
jgi:hypothetical protein